MSGPAAGFALEAEHPCLASDITTW